MGSVMYLVQFVMSGCENNIKHEYEDEYKHEYEERKLLHLGGTNY